MRTIYVKETGEFLGDKMTNTGKNNTEKQCPICNEIKPIDNFRKNYNIGKFCSPECREENHRLSIKKFGEKKKKKVIDNVDNVRAEYIKEYTINREILICPNTGLHFRISEKDFDKVTQWKWHALKKGNEMYMYAKHLPGAGKTPYNLALHRFITSAGKGEVVDHLNHNTQDNRRENLKVVTQSQNLLNRKGANRNSKTGIRGVSFAKNNITNPWKATYKYTRIGNYPTIEEAKAAYDNYVETR